MGMTTNPRDQLLVIMAETMMSEAELRAWYAKRSADCEWNLNTADVIAELSRQLHKQRGKGEGER